MKLKNKFIALLAIIMVAVGACKTEVQNPVLTDADLKVFFFGVGNDVKGVAWEGYNVLVGESVTVDLQVSPKEDTDVKWQLEDGTVLNNSTSYTYTAEQEETQRTLFIATRSSGVADTTLFNFRGVLDGQTSEINNWQNILIEQGGQTGTFTAEFDVIPSKDIMDGVVGFNNGIATTYSNLSCIVRFNGSGKIDAHNGLTYVSDNEITYMAGMTYHFRMEVDATTMKYKAYVTPQGGDEIIINEDLSFRNTTSNLLYWSMVAGDWQIDDPGTHRVFNMVITTHTINVAPVFAAVEDQQVKEGGTLELAIEASDPLGGFLKLEANSLPRYATFEDFGGGKGLIKFAPYANCGGCDLGTEAISIIATNKETTTEQLFNITVFDPFAVTLISADLADVDVYFGAFANDPAKPFVWTGAGTILVGGGVNWQDANDVYDMTAVFPFQLPEIPAGKRFGGASMTASLTNVVPWAWQDYDLYGISFRAGPTVLGTDYYQGVYDGDPTATALQQQWAVKETPVGPIATSDAGNLALVDYLNAQLDAGAVGGDYVFLRVSVSVDDAPTYGRIDIESADSGNGPVLAVIFE